MGGGGATGIFMTSSQLASCFLVKNTECNYYLQRVGVLRNLQVRFNSRETPHFPDNFQLICIFCWLSRLFNLPYILILGCQTNTYRSTHNSDIVKVPYVYGKLTCNISNLLFCYHLLLLSESFERKHIMHFSFSLIVNLWSITRK